MKIDVYQEQYRSKRAYHEPGKIGFGFDASIVEDAGNALINASIKKMEQDDALNSARIEADTAHAADKMLQDYKATANPDDFVGDMERQQQGIQTLIKDQSKNFKTKAAQAAFMKKMTRGIEEPYVRQSLQYSYELQATTATQKVQQGLDAQKAQLLDGNSLITPQEAIANAMQYIDRVSAPYHMTQQQINAMKQTTIKEFVVSYAYGIMDKDPYALKDMLLGNNFDKFKDAKTEEGQPFTMEDFWANEELQKEYSNSEYGANWINISEHLDYPTRMQLWKLADESIDKKQKEAIKAAYAANALTKYELDNAQEAMELQGKADGSYVTQWAGPSTRESGSVDAPIRFGEIKYGPIDKSKGRYVTKEAETFAKGIAGSVPGYRTYLTSSVRPDDTDSKHKDGSAVDIQIFKSVNGKDVWSLDGSIKAYAEAVKLYGNNMRKGGTLFEVDPSKIMYVKAELTKLGVPLDYVNWEQSEKYGAAAMKEGRQHIHFGIDPKADYTKTSSGTGNKYNFTTQLGGAWYDYYKAQGKSDIEAYGLALDKEDKIEANRYAYNIKQAIITGKGTASGQATDPAMYGKSLVEYRNAVVNDKKLSDRERIIKLKALDYLETELPKAQKQFEDDPAGFIEQNYNTTDTTKNVAIQATVYGIAPNEIRTMTDSQAKTEANKLMRATGEQFVAMADKYSMSDVSAIAAHIQDPNKAGLFQYIPMASAKGKADIQDAITKWDDVKEFIKQEKNAGKSKVFGKGSNWEAYIQGELLNNGVISGYLSDIEKTDPGARSRFLNAMTTLYAYRAFQKGSDGDPKVIINDMAQDFIGSNYNTLSIRGPYWGATSVNISNKAFGGNATTQIKECLDIVSKLGINPNKIGAFDTQALLSESEKIDPALQKVMDIKNKNDHIANIKTAQLHGSFDGMSVSFAFGNTKQTPYAGNIMRTTEGTKAKIQLSDLVAIDTQADKMIENWHRGSKGYYIPGEGKYTPKDNYGNIVATTRQNAKKAAIEHLLIKKYPWLNSSDYNEFVKKIWVSKYENTLYDPKTRRKEEAANWSNPTANFKGYYQIKYDENGKEISRKKLN